MLFSNTMVFGLKGKYVLPLVVLCIAVGDWLVEGKRNTQSTERELLVERKLQLLNKPAVKSFQTEEGDIIDCVDIYKQPAFDHPRLKNHKIQMRPHDPFSSREKTSSSVDSFQPSQKAESLHLSSQAWKKSGSCLEGTIPIRRVQKHHLLSSPSIENFGKKNSNVIRKHEVYLTNQNYDLKTDNFHSASLLYAAGWGYAYIGAQANLNVWNPNVEVSDEYSSSQIWIANKDYSIEFGWTVNPAVYHDKRTRLFIYWTNDYGKAGCFDLLCPGFVQTNPDIVLGGLLDPVSVEDGTQYYISLYVWKDFDSGNWWLMMDNKTAIGYWPSLLWEPQFNIAQLVMWGGDVYSPRVRNQSVPHTRTQMGSGNFASRHYKHASFIEFPRILDLNHFLKYPDLPSTISMETNCYSGENWAEKLFTEPRFYFGGPGRNMDCP